MAITVEAIYENGVLKPAHALPLKEHDKVRLTIEPAPGLADRSYGLLGWTGDAETFDRIRAELEEPEEIP